MHPSISGSYIIPAIFLNPILFLISVNTILSRILPPIIVDAVIQPPPYSTFGPSAEHPHLDVHASESLCWSYTFLIVCAQLVAFGRVSEHRGVVKQKAAVEKRRAHAHDGCTSKKKMKFQNGHIHLNDGNLERKQAVVNSETQAYYSCAESDLESVHEAGSDDSYGTTDSETIL